MGTPHEDKVEHRLKCIQGLLEEILRVLTPAGPTAMALFYPDCNCDEYRIVGKWTCPVHGQMYRSGTLWPR